MRRVYGIVLGINILMIIISAIVVLNIHYFGRYGNGVIVTRINKPNTLAYSIGLAAGSLIYSISGNRVHSSEELHYLLSSNLGKTVNITWQDKGHIIMRPATLPKTQPSHGILGIQIVTAFPILLLIFLRIFNPLLWLILTPLSLLCCYVIVQRRLHVAPRINITISEDTKNLILLVEFFATGFLGHYILKSRENSPIYYDNNWWWLVLIFMILFCSHIIYHSIKRLAQIIRSGEKIKIKPNLSIFRKRNYQIVFSVVSGVFIIFIVIPGILIDQANHLFYQKKYQQATSYYNWAFTIDPLPVTTGGYTSLTNRGLSFFEIGMYKQAITDFERALEVLHHTEETYLVKVRYSANLWFIKGFALAHIQNYSDAISALDSGLKLDPTNVDALNMKAWSMAKIDKSQEALPVIDKALEKDPNNSLLLDTKGFVLYKLGEYGQSNTYYDKALKIDPKDPIIWINKALAISHLSMHLKPVAQSALDNQLNGALRILADGAADYTPTTIMAACGQLNGVVLISQDYITAHLLTSAQAAQMIQLVQAAQKALGCR